MDDRIKTILEDVAAGRVDPAEAARLLDEARATSTGSADSGAAAGEPGPPALPDVTRVSIRAVSRGVRLVADPTVTTVSIDGPHVVRRDGSTLIVTGEPGSLPNEEGFSFLMLSAGRWRDLLPKHQTMTVRVRPDLAVGVEITAGSLTSEGARALDHVRVTAGSAKITGVTEPVDVLVQAGSVDLSMVPKHGHSRVRCESGSLKLRLGPGSDVRVDTDIQLGKVTMIPPTLAHGANKEPKNVMVGGGTATLDVEVVMGSAQIEVAK
jgi:hypothetical protein